jgi:hypothetical protein
MTSAPQRLLAITVAGLLAVATAPVGAAAPARTAVPPDVTRVVGTCSGGPGRLSVTVRPRGGGSYRVTVKARRVREVDSQWRIGVLAFARDGEEVRTTFRRRPVGRSWSFATDVRFGRPVAASFLVDAQRLREDGTGADRCLVGNSPGRPEGAFVPCGRGIQLLALRPQEDGTLVVRQNLIGVAPRRTWNLQVEMATEDSGIGVGVTARSNRNGVVRQEESFGDVSDLVDPVLTAQAERPGGTRCWVRLDPGTLTPGGGGGSPAELLGRRGLEI